MIIGNIINDSFGLITKQLRFYCWHFRKSLDQRQRQELIELLYEQRFESLANKIKSLNQNSIADYKQQVGKLLFDYCFNRNRRHQLIQLIESDLVDINVRLDNYGRTLLHRAAYSLDLELVRILIEHKVNIKLRDYAGNTALHIAIQSYRNGAVIYGIESGVVQNLTSIIKLLLEADKKLQNERNKQKTSTSCRVEEGQVSLPSGNVDFPLTDENYNRAVDLNNNSQHVSYTSHIIQSRELNETKNTVSQVKNCKVTDKSKYGSSIIENKDLQSREGQSLNSENGITESINPILLEDATSPLVDTKNAFGRTALHYCVLVVGEQHLAHFVQLLISYGADVDSVDTRMKTPLYCLVKRPGVSAMRQKCLAIKYLLDGGCDDLGLAIDTKTFFDDKLILELESNASLILQARTESSIDPIFDHDRFKRVPSLRHISRLKLIKLQDRTKKLKRQTKIVLPKMTPETLNIYMNRKILDQKELF